MSLRRLLVILALTSLTILIFTACNRTSPTSNSSTAAVSPSSVATTSPEPTKTPIPPTETPIPLAATVNGEAITLAEFQSELAHYQSSVVISGTNLAPDPEKYVLDNMIDEKLLAQSAAQDGFTVDDTLLQTRIEALAERLGGAQALDEWKSAHGYTEAEFEKSLRQSITAAWMRDQVIAAVPETADQVHVIQIMLPTKTQADEAYAALESGDDFQDLAATYNIITGGDLGWFPRDYLGEPAIDEAAFALQPGQYSQVIESDSGFHILYLVERDTNHPLQPDARRVLQTKALKDWMSEQWDNSDIQILLP